MEQTLHNAFKRFSLGDELRAYTFLGCHAAERDGVHGYVFRVWAPRAQGVSVTGDWNFWNTEDLPMTLVEYGIWEAFSAYAREGDAYKFYIRRRDGSAVYKSDPYAFRNCALPDTSSRICTLDGYTWGDADYRRKQGKRKLLNCPMNIYEMHFGSWRRKGIEVGDKQYAAPDAYTVLGFNFASMYNFGYKFRAGVSLDGVYDGSANVAIADQIVEMGSSADLAVEKPGVDRQLALGVSARAEFVMPYFNIGVGLGTNFLHKGGDLKAFYQMLILKVAVTRSSYVHIGYSLRDFHMPNFLMLGVGYRFNNKYPRHR